MQNIGAERNIRNPLAQPDTVQIRTQKDCDLKKTCISVASSTLMEVVPLCAHELGATSGVSIEQWSRVPPWAPVPTHTCCENLHKLFNFSVSSSENGIKSQ